MTGDPLFPDHGWDWIGPGPLIPVLVMLLTMWVAWSLP